MGLYDLNNPGRAGFEAAKYDGWSMTNIIYDFINNHNLAVEKDRVAFRKAILVSDEFNMVSKGVRFSV